MMKVAILGCGPAGLFAAHAANRAGADFEIFSKKIRSNMAGAQFLHMPIPGLLEEAAPVTILRWGSEEAYSRKATGKGGVLDTSWGRWDAARATVWSLGAAYDAAWRGYHDAIVPGTVDHSTVELLLGEFDMVVSTVPLPAILDPEHTEGMEFKSQEVYIVPAEKVRGNLIIFNGLEGREWYRYSCLFGAATLEFADSLAAQDMAVKLGSKVVKAVKPYDITHPRAEHMQPRVLKVGRHGRWDKLALTHEGFYRVYDELLREMMPK